MTNTSIQIDPVRLGPVRIFSWFGAFVFMATAPLGCGGCSPMETAAHAQELATVAVPRPTLEEVAGELICDYPSCSKESLHECTSCEYAVKYRKEIATLLEQGKTKPEILTHFADTYGEQLLGNPRHPVATVVPFAAALMGLIPLAVFARSKRRQPLQKQPLQKPTKGRQTKTSVKASKPLQQSNSSEDPRVAETLRDYDY